MYLVDTDVLSSLAKRRIDPRVDRWFRSHEPERLFLSVVTVGEIARGIARRHDLTPSFAASLAAWLEATIAEFGERILPVDTAVARRWGLLSARLGNDGADLLIAATAIQHDLIVVTRNVRHFVPTGAAVENPFDPA